MPDSAIVTAIRLLIHGWELPSFDKTELRRNTRTALRHALEQGIGGLSRVDIDFDELRPERPRDPEELARWKSPIRDAIDMEFETRPRDLDEDRKLVLAQELRPAVSRLTFYVLRGYIEADAHNRAARRHLWGRRL